MPTENLDYFIAHIHEPLPADLVNKIGLTVYADTPTHPHTWASLSDRERTRALSVFPSYRIDATTPTVESWADAAGVADAARVVSDGLYRLGREWEALLEGITDQDQSDAMRRALEQGFPFDKSLDDLEAEAGSWAEHLAELRLAAPSLLTLVAAELADNVDDLVADAKNRQPNRDVDEVYREMVNGGLGGVPGRIAGIFTPVVISALAALMQEIHHSGDGKITETAAGFARTYRAARRASRGY